MVMNSLTLAWEEEQEGQQNKAIHTLYKHREDQLQLRKNPKNPKNLKMNDSQERQISCCWGEDSKVVLELETEGIVVAM